MTAKPPNNYWRNLAEMWESIGRVPLERIVMNPLPGTATEADVIALEGKADKRLCELIDGVLVEKAMGYRESLLAEYLSRKLGIFVDDHNLGLVATADGMIRMASRNIRIPDVSFVPWDNIPGGRVPDEPVPGIAPTLAVEVLSVSNTNAEMLGKRQDYFGSGCRIVWQIDPRTRTVEVFDSVDTLTTLTEADTLDGTPVLPGFTLPLRELFGRLDRHA